MSKLERLEREVAELTADDLARFRDWFAAFDAAAWDARISRDVASGALDKIADAAIAEHRAGRSRPF